MKVGRNDPCPCGSGLKYKYCCLPRTKQAEAINRAVYAFIRDLDPTERAAAIRVLGKLMAREDSIPPTEEDYDLVCAAWQKWKTASPIDKDILRILDFFWEV